MAKYYAEIINISLKDKSSIERYPIITIKKRFLTAEQVIVVFRKRIFKLSGKGICPVYQKCMDATFAEDKEKRRLNYGKKEFEQS